MSVAADPDVPFSPTCLQEYALRLRQSVFAMAAGVPAETPLQDVLGHASALVGADAAGLLFFATPGESLRSASMFGRLPPAFFDAVRSLPMIDSGPVFQNPEGIRVHAGEAAPFFAPLATLLLPERMASIHLVPLKFMDLRMGVLFFAWERREEARPGQMAVAICLAADLALALNHERLLREHRTATVRLADRVSEVSLLAELSAKISRSLDLDITLREIVEGLPAVVGGTNCFIILADRDGRTLRGAAASTGMRPYLEQIRFGIEETSGAGEAFLRKETVAVTDAQADPRVNRRLVEMVGEKSMLFVPLLLGDRALGVVVFDDTRRRRTFTREQIERAQAVANQLAVAIDRITLFADLRKSHADLVQTQAKLVEAARMAAIGEMSAVVAHEIRNPLGIIQNSIEILRRSPGDAASREELFKVLGQEMQRLTRMLSEFLVFSRPKSPLRARYDLVSALQGVSDLARRDAEWIPTMELDLRTPPAPFSWDLDLDLFKQAMLNLIRNAVQAMPEGGKLTIELVPPAPPGGSMEILVRDTGVGISRESRSRIFEPFYSTRPQGTGLGLSIVRQILEAHGGSVTAESGFGSGTTFRTVWPEQDLRSSPAKGKR